ncbi:MAG: hypothetical protein ACR2QG_03630 [Gammaproteobacteria bacterium]
MTNRNFIVLLLLFGSLNISAQDIQDGQVKRDPGGELVAWDAEKEQWLDIESFWLSYAGRRGGLTWGRNQNYPQYDQVQEFDIFLVELSQGTCLMEFFHTRWRRANDVRRWDDAFNQYGGCPYVFD